MGISVELYSRTYMQNVELNILYITRFQYYIFYSLYIYVCICMYQYVHIIFYYYPGIYFNINNISISIKYTYPGNAYSILYFYKNSFFRNFTIDATPKMIFSTSPTKLALQRYIPAPQQSRYQWQTPTQLECRSFQMSLSTS